MAGAASLALIFAANFAFAQEEPKSAPPPEPAAPAATTEKSVVTGTRMSDGEERRYSTATKIVFGREELDRYGDTSLGEVLKRLPGVTISGARTRRRHPDARAGPRLHDDHDHRRGEPRGFRRIRSPRNRWSASRSCARLRRAQRAIAGSINIVLREELVRRENDCGPGWAGKRALAAGNLGAEERHAGQVQLQRRRQRPAAGPAALCGDHDHRRRHAHGRARPGAGAARPEQQPL
ncbi:MAG: Plug domain-containing protein [Betaproteobacteria bacterium]|nr:Plug domain-containing protein [Betaproteobacteria bacterium]